MMNAFVSGFVLYICFMKFSLLLLKLRTSHLQFNHHDIPLASAAEGQREPGYSGVLNPVLIPAAE